MQLNDATSIVKDNVEKKLIIRQLIFIVIIAVLVFLDARNIITGRIDLILAVSGFLLATTVGLALSRMFKIFWHEEKNKVISKLDTTGAILLVIYISFEINRAWIFQHWLTGDLVNVFGLVVLSGLLLGRFLGTVVKIKNVLIENDKLN